MNLTRAAVVLRERRSLEVADLMLRFVRSVAPVAYARLTALVLAPLYAGCLALRYLAGWEWPAVWLCAFAAWWVAQAPFTVLAGRAMFGDAVDSASGGLWQVLRDTLRRLGVYLPLSALKATLLLFSSFTVIGPLLVWVYTAYLNEAVLLEGAGAKGGLERARRFVAGRTGACVEMLLINACILTSCVVLWEVCGFFLVSYVLQIELPFDELFDDGGSVFSLAGALFSAPLMSTLRFLFYINERTIRDGWDVQVRFLGIRDELAQHT